MDDIYFFVKWEQESLASPLGASVLMWGIFKSPKMVILDLNKAEKNFSFFD